jgi:hypothetical protein
MDDVRHRSFVSDARRVQVYAVCFAFTDFFFMLVAGIFVDDFFALLLFEDALDAGEAFGAVARDAFSEADGEDAVAFAAGDAIFAFFLSALAIESASQSFFFGTPAVADVRLLSHAAEPASPAISFMVRPVSADLSYWSMS